MRSGLTLVELVVTVLILSIGAAIVVPKWSSYQDSIRASSAALAFSSDVQALQRYAAQSSQTLTLSVTVGGSTMTITPAVPKLIGDTNGVVDYARRYPGFTFQSATFSGSSTVTIDMRGDLISGTGEVVQSGDVALQLGGNLVNVELLSSLVSSNGPSESPSAAAASPAAAASKIK